MKSGVFIIESLDLEDEEKGLFEGKIITEILKMIGVDVHYVYIRTREELKLMIGKFEESNYKYLHLSCHGNNTGIATTLDEYSFPFSEFSSMFSYEGRSTRLFLSSCSVMNGEDIITGMLDTNFLSITGPLEDIRFSDATVFWASFYHLMFKENTSSMENEHFKKSLNTLSNTFNVKMSTVIRKKGSREYNKYRYGVLEEAQV